MTVAVLIRGPEKTCNVLVVDSGVGSFLADGTPTYDCSHDKLRLAFGNTYFTVVGDALLMDALISMVAWADPKRPDLRRPETFHALVAGVERLRRIQVTNGQGVAPDPRGAHLLVCNRQEAFCWRAAFDVSSGRFERPQNAQVIEPGSGIGFWGGDTQGPIDASGMRVEEAFKGAIDAMLALNEQVEALDFKLPYPLTRRCSGVLLPHKTTTELRRIRPFDSLPEQWVKYRGDRAMALLDDRDFMDFPTVTFS